MNYLQKKGNAFKYAFNGLKIAFSYESNLFVHLIIAAICIVTASFLNFSSIEWITLLIIIGFVISCELFNTAIELVCDFMTSAYDLKIKAIKDISAAAVLFASLVAFICGIILFLPKIISL